jgi:hypothetical protein
MEMELGTQDGIRPYQSGREPPCVCYPSRSAEREPPSFPEDIALVRDRVRKTIGRVGVPKALTAQHPAIARLIAQDDARRQKADGQLHVFLGGPGF